MESEDEALIASQQRDRRIKVKKNDIEYKNIVRLKVWKRCCPTCREGPFRGTGFFIRRTGNTVHFLTAAHVIYCADCDELADSVNVYRGDGLSIGEIDSDTTNGWLQVCPRYKATRFNRYRRRQYDYGMLAMEVPDGFASSLGNGEVPTFSVARAWPSQESFLKCTVSGFPVKFKDSKCLEMVRDSDGITAINTYKGHNVRLWKHKIDTSGGQSGAPVFDACGTVFGIHIGFGHGPDGKAEFNLAVALDAAMLEFALSRFTSGASGDEGADEDFMADEDEERHFEKGSGEPGGSYWDDYYDTQPFVSFKDNQSDTAATSFGSPGASPISQEGPRDEVDCDSQARGGASAHPTMPVASQQSSTEKVHTSLTPFTRDPPKMPDGFNFWEEVVEMKAIMLHSKLDPHPDSSLLLAMCKQEGLITSAQKDAIKSGLRAGGTVLAANTQLLEILSKTGRQGYIAFKKILKNLSKESMTNKNVYDEIEAMEKEACGGARAPPAMPVPNQQSGMDSSYKGQRLARGDVVLFEVSQLLADEGRCRNLAIHLLQSYPGGGIAFIDSKMIIGSAINWQVMAHNVLTEWCRIDKHATKGELHRICTKINAHDAAEQLSPI